MELLTTPAPLKVTTHVSPPLDEAQLSVGSVPTACPVVPLTVTPGCKAMLKAPAASVIGLLKV
jgi:hypothetical protein